MPARLCQPLRGGTAAALTGCRKIKNRGGRETLPPLPCLPWFFRKAVYPFTSGTALPERIAFSAMGFTFWQPSVIQAIIGAAQGQPAAFTAPMPKESSRSPFFIFRSSSTWALKCFPPSSTVLMPMYSRPFQRTPDPPAGRSSHQSPGLCR